ncbi:uracil phosphoribosyltransferase-domain-containing protein [Podospora didyma]|uniref:Uracil phosphoribosyltransferase-domain-containing protein n=1 Tax=Podospora didyma TaxID=330526 RepID=A0AAE0U249_9PEZI|nr:uracil phosphoribosyltransferase-domain-containing protein [Podospora didyma]
MMKLRYRCYVAGILLATLPKASSNPIPPWLKSPTVLFDKTVALMKHFHQQHTERSNLELAMARLDNIIVNATSKEILRELETALAFDGDKTLAADDTGVMYWAGRCGHTAHKLRVWAFGDSPMDLPMMLAANGAIVVVGHEQERSKTMDAALLKAIDVDGLCARQTMMSGPKAVTPRLDVQKLPLVYVDSSDFVDAVFHHRQRHEGQECLVLPCERLTSESGHQTSGHRLKNEESTTIIALMRAGEPMAFGVSDVFPSAMFLHASEPENVKPHHLLGPQGAAVLVDSVVNSGKSVVEFVSHIRNLNLEIRIVVVAGVVQEQAISHGSALGDSLARDASLKIVTLRVSENKYTGSGTTDTGNRLFNTTHLA